MAADVGQRKDLYRIIRRLPLEDVEKVASYAGFLRWIQDKEDREDLRIIEERADEPLIPWSFAKKELEL